MMHMFLTLVLLFSSSAILAGPGAHGPNGEHLDAPSGSQLSAASALPRMEAVTETFELTASLYPEELSILIDSFDTNAPVHGAKVEVEFNGIKAVGQFHADHGDYSVNDAGLLKALASPGKHPLLVTVLAGDDNDLMEGVMQVGPTPAAAQEHAKGWLLPTILGLVLVLVLFGAGAWLRRRSTKIGN